MTGTIRVRASRFNLDPCAYVQGFLFAAGELIRLFALDLVNCGLDVFQRAVQLPNMRGVTTKAERGLSLGA